MLIDLFKKTAVMVIVAGMLTSCGERVDVAKRDLPVYDDESESVSIQPTTVHISDVTEEFVLSTDTVKIEGLYADEEDPEETTEDVTEKKVAGYETTTELGIRTTAPDDYVLPDCHAVYVPTVMQRPELPTGCEITSLTQTLNFYGFDVSKTYLVDNFLPIDYNYYYSMNDVYMGSPYTETGYGCNAPVITKVANNYFDCIGSDWQAIDISGVSFDDILYNIAEDRPVIMWATMWMYEEPPEYLGVLGCGEELIFSHYQHCVTVYGFDYRDNTVHVADPLVGNTTYSVSRVEKIYEMMGSQAVILYGKDETAGIEYTSKEYQEAWIRESGVGGVVEIPEDDNDDKAETTSVSE